MAASSLRIVLVFLLPALAFCAFSPYNHYNLKSLNFSLYQHDTFNQTDFMIYPGVPGVNVSATSAPFGSIVVIQGSLTVGPSKTTVAVGVMEAVSITSTMDGLKSINVAKVSFFGFMGLKGSISVTGVGSTIEPSEAPVSGGTGDFLFVQGYMNSTLISANQDLSTVYKIDFHLFWPPYAPFARKG